MRNMICFTKYQVSSCSLSVKVVHVSKRPTWRREPQRPTHTWALGHIYDKYGFAERLENNRLFKNSRLQSCISVEAKGNLSPETTTVAKSVSGYQNLTVKGRTINLLNVDMKKIVFTTSLGHERLFKLDVKILTKNEMINWIGIQKFVNEELAIKWTDKSHKTEKKLKEKINVQFKIVITFGGRRLG